LLEKQLVRLPAFPALMAAAAIGFIPAHAARAQAKLAEYYGTCEASAAVAVGRDHFLVADDQDSVIRLYARNNPKPIMEQDFSADLGIAPGEKDLKKRKTDIEAVAAIGKRVYWLTSHAGTWEWGRRFFATDMVGQGADSKLKFVGVYKDLRTDLNDSEFADAYGLKNDNADDPAKPGGFNIEGLAAMPEGKLLIGFRNPIPENKALIVRFDNPDEVLTHQDAKPSAKARFGKAYLVDLDGLGIRSLERIGTSYLIVAGSYLDCPCLSVRLWSGVDGQKPRVVPLPVLADTALDFRPEAMFVIPRSNRVQLLSDDGDVPRLRKTCKGDPARRRLRSFMFRL
jgi:Protein of unknown function (DUF3616)